MYSAEFDYEAGRHVEFFPAVEMQQDFMEKPNFAIAYSRNLGLCGSDGGRIVFQGWRSYGCHRNLRRRRLVGTWDFFFQMGKSSSKTDA